jgi:osmoprotectant transport system substrate-binding protein
MFSTVKKIISISLIGLVAVAFMASCSAGGTITVASKDFSENILLGELMAQLIEAKTDLKVNRKLNLGGTFVNFNAIQNGQIDVYPEYTGTSLTAQLNMEVINDPAESYRVVSEEMLKRWDIVWLDPFGFNNTYTLAVTAEVQEKYNLKTYSDLIPIADQLVFGAEHEFFDRQDGFDGLVAHYGLQFKGEPMKLNTSLKYQAIGKGDMDITDAFSTDGPIKQYDLRILEDDKSFFPPYHAAPVVRKAVLEQHPEVGEALNLLAGKINDETMTELNYLVDVQGEPVEEVAKAFLESLNLV